LTSITSEAAAGTAAILPRDKDAPFRLVQVASLSDVKNQRLLIDALAIVRNTANAHLDLVGEDTLGGELQNHVASIGLGPHVAFHGFLPQSRVREILSAADLYVQSSLHEAAGVSVLEAAASGVPVLGTLAGYVADWSPVKATGLRDAVPESLAGGDSHPTRRR
jgi:glycosyltransferase involved in cell wall biosynthesis